MSRHSRRKSARPIVVFADRILQGSGLVVNYQPSTTSLAGTSAPVLVLAVAADIYPPKLDISLGEAVQIGDTLRLQAASDPAFIYKLFDTAQAISSGNADSKAASLPGLSAVAQPAQTFFRARIERSGNFTAWSNTLKHGDTVRPTITSNAEVTYAEMAPLAHQLTAAEPTAWAIVGGRDVSSLEIAGSTLRLAGNAKLDHERQPVYQVVVRATDLGENSSEQLVTIKTSDIGEQANSFAFPPIKNSALAQPHTSGTFTVAGLAAGVSVPVSVTSGSYAKNGGPFVSTDGVVANGDKLAVRTNSSGDYSTTASAVLTLGEGAEAVKSSFAVTTLPDPLGVGWSVNATPPIRNVGYAANFADFAAIGFNAGLGIIMVSSNGRRIEMCSVDGANALLVCESGSKVPHVSIWAVAIAKAGSRTVRVANSAWALADVVITAGTLSNNSPDVVQTASLEYGYYPSPVSLGTLLTIPPHGLGLIAAISETGTISPQWIGAAEDGNVSGGSAVPINHAFAHVNKPDMPKLAGWNYSGTAIAAAVWRP